MIVKIEATKRQKKPQTSKLLNRCFDSHYCFMILLSRPQPGSFGHVEEIFLSIVTGSLLGYLGSQQWVCYITCSIHLQQKGITSKLLIQWPIQYSSREHQKQHSYFRTWLQVRFQKICSNFSLLDGVTCFSICKHQWQNRQKKSVQEEL